MRDATYQPVLQVSEKCSKEEAAALPGGQSLEHSPTQPPVTSSLLLTNFMIGRWGRESFLESHVPPLGSEDLKSA